MTTLTEFLTARPTAAIAAALLGKRLTLQTAAGPLSTWITETEAYLGVKDAGAHAYQNHQTPRNQVLWQAAGTIYVYQMRTWYLLNIVTQAAGTPECVLIRAGEPITGQTQMQQNRPVPLARLTDGPGKLMQAFGLRKELNGQRLNDGPLQLDLQACQRVQEIGQTPRIGINNKGSWSTAPLRYYVIGNPWVSKIARSTIDQEHHGWT